MCFQESKYWDEVSLYGAKGGGSAGSVEVDGEKRVVLTVPGTASGKVANVGTGTTGGKFLSRVKKAGKKSRKGSIKREASEQAERFEKASKGKGVKKKVKSEKARVDKVKGPTIRNGAKKKKAAKKKATKKTAKRTNKKTTKKKTATKKKATKRRAKKS